MSIEEFYNEIKKNGKANTELNQLYKKPVPEKGLEMPKTQVFNKNTYYEADCLYMPDDNGFKYILVCVDLYDGTLDAEPLKELKPNVIVGAFGKIFKRNYLDYPVFLTLDKGSEFNSQIVIDYFEKVGTTIKFSLTGRSRQLATVERANQKIGTILFKRMTSQELITGEPSKEWVDDLHPLVEVLNKHKKKTLKVYPDKLPLVDEFNGKLFKIGQKVRILLDYPINNTNNARLNGKFRSSDIKWTPQMYKITEVLLKPNYPPMYLTDKNDNVGRTKNQLSKVRKNEKEPKAKFIRGNPEFYIPQEILNKRKVGRKEEYLVRWKGFDENEATWEPSTIFDRTKDLKKMKKKYNDEN